MKKFNKIFLTSMLSISIAICSYPVVSADLILEKDDENYNISENQPVDEKNAVEREMREKAGLGVVEIESLRDEYTKYYQIGDGLYQSVTYDKPIHFLDENGKWKDIDGSVALSDSIDTSLDTDNQQLNANGKGNPSVPNGPIQPQIKYSDTYIDRDNPTANYGSSKQLWISSGRVSFLNIIYNPPAIYSDVSSATLHVRYHYNVSSGSLNVGVYRCEESWSENLLTWNSANSHYNLGISNEREAVASLPASSSITASTPGTASFNVKSIVEQWSAGIANRGFALKYEGGQNTSVILESSEASSSYSAKLTVTYKTVTPIIKNGTYFMKTGASGNYMQIDDNDGPNYSTSGSIFELWKFDGEPYQKWNFTYLHNGYYKITSEKSGKAITVTSEDLYTDGSELYQRSYAGLERQQWKITKTSHGMYKIKARSSEGFSTDLCMAAGAGALTYDGRNVEQRKYVNDTNYKDEWIIESINPLLITLCGIYNSGHDHNSSLEACRPNLNRYGYNNIDYISGSISGMNCRSHLLNTNVFISRSHGCALTDSVSGALISTGIVLNDSSSVDAFYSHYWSGMSSGSSYVYSGDSFPKLKLALFIACESAKGRKGANNLPTAFVDHGTTVAVGFYEKITCSDANKWTEDFYTYFLAGYTVEESVSYACGRRSNSSGLKSAEICGNGSYRLGQ